MIQRYLLLLLCATSLAGFYWPAMVPEGTPDPFVQSKPFIGWMIAMAMLAIGYMLPKAEVTATLRRWPTVLMGTGVQYVTMPTLAWLTARLFGLGQEAEIGVLIVGCVPGAMASNVLTLNARGNTSYSVSLTTAATLLSPVMVPLTLWLTLGTTVKQDGWGVAQSLLLTVVLPVIAGHLIRRFVPRGEHLAQPIASGLANLVIVWIIAVVVGLNRELLAKPAGGVLAPLLLINLLGYLAGYGAGKALRFPEGMRRALTLEVGMQNAGVGTFLALTFFKDQPAAAIPPAIYTFGCMFTGTILARVWAMVPPAEEPASEPPAQPQPVDL